MSIQVEFIRVWNGKEFTYNANVDVDNGNFAISIVEDSGKKPRKSAKLEDEFIMYFENEFDVNQNADGTYSVSEDSVDDFMTLVNG